MKHKNKGFQITEETKITKLKMIRGLGVRVGRVNQRRHADERSQLTREHKQTIHLARNVQRKEVEVLK